MGMNLSKFQKRVGDIGAWCAAVHGSQRVRHDLATENNHHRFMSNQECRVRGETRLLSSGHLGGNCRTPLAPWKDPPEASDLLDMFGWDAGRTKVLENVGASPGESSRKPCHLFRFDQKLSKASLRTRKKPALQLQIHKLPVCPGDEWM